MLCCSVVLWLRCGHVQLPLPDPPKYALPEDARPGDASASVHSSSTHHGSAGAVEQGTAASAHSAATLTADQDSMSAGVAEKGYLQSAEESWPRGLPFPSYLEGWEELLPGQHQQQQQQLGQEAAGQQQQQVGTVVGNPLFALDAFNTGPSPAQDHAQLPQDITSTHSAPKHSNGPLLHTTAAGAAAAAPSVAHPATAPAAALGRLQQLSEDSYRPGRLPALNEAPAGPAAADPPQQTPGTVAVPLVALGGTAPAKISSSSNSRGPQDWPNGNSSSASGSSSGGSDADSLDVNGWDLPCGGRKKPKGDALDVLLLRMQHIRAELADAQAADERDPYPAALVTFR